MEIIRTDLRPADDDDADALCTIITEAHKEFCGGEWTTVYLTTASGEVGYEDSDAIYVDPRYAKTAYHETRAFCQHWAVVQKAVDAYTDTDDISTVRQITYYEDPALVR